jgi:flagellar biosynthesis protein FlhG
VTTLTLQTAASRPASRIGPSGHDDQAAGLRALARMLGVATHEGMRLGVPLLAVTSGKGGVGKTTLSVNLSIALTRLGMRTTLVDADLGMANADVMCGLTPGRRLEHALGLNAAGHPTPPLDLRSLAVNAPGGFRLIPGSVGIAHMAELPEEERLRLLAALIDLEHDSDVVVADTGAGIGPGVMAFLRAATLVLVIATPDPASITDAYALVKCLHARGTPRVALVVNQACNEDEAAAVHGRLAACCGRFLGTALPLVGWIPTDQRVHRSVRQRRPLLVSSRRSPAGRAMVAVAREVVMTIGNRPRPVRNPNVRVAVTDWLRSMGLFSSRA